MFEKIHSHQLKKNLLKKMDETNDFLLPISIHENRWLKTALQNENAALFFAKETKEKIENALKSITAPDVNHIREKGTTQSLERQSEITTIHRSIRHAILQKRAFLLSYVLNDGEKVTNAEGLPYKLEFYVQKQQWYVLWVKKNHDMEYIISTPLPNILGATFTEIDRLEYEQYMQQVEMVVDREKQRATIELNAKVFDEQAIQQHRHRIFYAFSCFDKEVIYDEVEHNFQIHVYYRETEKFDLLQKLRFLGSRVIVKGPEELRLAMKQTANEALKRYKM